jgi:hypothetical protein
MYAEHFRRAVGCGLSGICGEQSDTVAGFAFEGFCLPPTVINPLMLLTHQLCARPDRHLITASFLTMQLAPLRAKKFEVMWHNVFPQAGHIRSFLFVILSARSYVMKRHVS